MKKMVMMGLFFSFLINQFAIGMQTSEDLRVNMIETIFERFLDDVENFKTDPDEMSLQLKKQYVYLMDKRYQLRTSKWNIPYFLALYFIGIKSTIDLVKLGKDMKKQETPEEQYSKVFLEFVDKSMQSIENHRQQIISMIEEIKQGYSENKIKKLVSTFTLDDFTVVSRKLDVFFKNLSDKSKWHLKSSITEKIRKIPNIPNVTPSTGIFSVIGPLVDERKKQLVKEYFELLASD